MIYRLLGKLIFKRNDFAVIDVNGVGYKVLMISESLKRIGQGDSVEVYCSFSIKQDGAVILLGFLSEKELEIFDLLNTVNGIGPKSALTILGNVRIPELVTAISEGNSSVLKKVSGVGEKTAQRIVLELKGKIDSLGEFESKEIMDRIESNSDLEGVLIEMGYRKPDIKIALLKLDSSTSKLEERLRQVLKLLQKK